MTGGVESENDTDRDSTLNERKRGREEGGKKNEDETGIPRNNGWGLDSPQQWLEVEFPLISTGAAIPRRSAQNIAQSTFFPLFASNL